MSVPNSSTIVGISSSPPATPMMAATTPIPNPATTPATTWTGPGRSRDPTAVVRVTTKAAAMATMRTARTL